MPTANSLVQAPSSLTGRPPQLPDGSLFRVPTQLHEAAMETIRSQSRILCAALWKPSPLCLFMPSSSQHPPGSSGFTWLTSSLPTIAHRADFTQVSNVTYCLTSEPSYQLVPSLCVPNSNPVPGPQGRITSLQVLFAQLPLSTHPDLP